MDTIIDSRNELKHRLAVEVLRSFGEARVPVIGASMLPALWPGDILEIRRQSATEILPGQLVLYERDGCFVTHRVVEKLHQQGRTLLVTRGDRLRKPDLPVRPEQVLGRVIAIQRGNHRIVPQLTVRGRVASWILGHSDFCTRVLLHFDNVRRRLTPLTWREAKPPAPASKRI